MNYFTRISEGCDSLSAIAQKYLDSLVFIPSEECCQRIWNWACNQMDSEENGCLIFNGKNEFAESIVEDGVPYAAQPANGSLHYSLGWSTVAQEANIRSLLEYVEGRQSEWIRFKTLANLPED